MPNKVPEKVNESETVVGNGKTPASKKSSNKNNLTIGSSGISSDTASTCSTNSNSNSPTKNTSQVVDNTSKIEKDLKVQLLRNEQLKNAQVPQLTSLQSAANCLLWNQLTGANGLAQFLGTENFIKG